MHMSPGRLRAYIAFISVAIIWGIASVVIKGTLEHLPPFQFLYFRFLVMLPITIPWYIWYMRKHPIKRSELVPLTGFGLMATTLYLSLIFLGFERTTAIDGNLLGTVAPIFIIVLGVLLLKEKITKWEGIGLSLAIIGSIITVIQPLLSGSAFPMSNLIGNSIVLLASIVWAFFVLLSKKNFKHFSPMHITLHGSMVAFPTFLIFAVLENNDKLPSLSTLTSNTPALLGVLYMSLVSYVLAFILYEYGMSKMEISEGSLFTYLQPLVATPLAIMFLDERVTTPFIVGAAIIALGVVLSQLRHE